MPNRFVPVETTIKSLGSAFDLKIAETYPAELKLFDPATGRWVTDVPWVTVKHLAPFEEINIPYYAMTPDRAGTYEVRGEVGYIDKGNYNFYQNLSSNIIVGRNMADLTFAIISDLDALSLTGQDRANADIAIRHMQNVQARAIVNRADTENNIADILKAIDCLLSITGADISGIRSNMDDLLRSWEARWFME